MQVFQFFYTPTGRLSNGRVVNGLRKTANRAVALPALATFFSAVPLHTTQEILRLYQDVVELSRAVMISDRFGNLLSESGLDVQLAQTIAFAALPTDEKTEERYNADILHSTFGGQLSNGSESRGLGPIILFRAMPSLEMAFKALPDQ